MFCLISDWSRIRRGRWRKTGHQNSERDQTVQMIRWKWDFWNPWSQIWTSVQFDLFSSFDVQFYITFLIWFWIIWKWAKLELKVAQIYYVSRNQLDCTANLNFSLMCKKAKHCWALSTNFSFLFSWHFLLIMFCFLLNWSKNSNSSK